MSLQDLMTLKDHLTAKANYWQRQGRADKVSEYMAELERVNEDIQNTPLELA